MIDEDLEFIKEEISSATCQDPLQYLSDELRLLDLKLLRRLHKKRLSHDQDQNNPAVGFFISEDEVVSLLKLSSEQKKYTSDNHQDEIVGNLITELENQIEDNISKTAGSFIRFPLQQMADLFGLDRFETEVLVMALALDIDKKYERIYAYFNDDLNKKAPSLDLALNTFGSNTGKITTGQRYFSDQSPLRAFKLIRFVNNHDEESFLSTRFKVDEGIKSFLLGDDGIHPQLRNVSNMEYPDKPTGLSGSKIKIQGEIRKTLSTSLESESKGLVFWLYGKSSVEKKSIIASLCSELNIHLLVADLEGVLSEQDPASTLQLLLREAVLKSAALFFTSGDLLSSEEERIRSLRRVTLKAIREFSCFTFIDAQDLWSPDDFEEAFDWYPIEVKAPCYFGRRLIWSELLQAMNIDEAYIDAVSSRYTFSESQIIKAASYLKLNLEENSVTLDALFKACSIQSSKKLPKYSKKVSPHYRWDDLVLPEDKLRHLQEICSFLKHKHLVYFKWGFDNKLALGRGLNVLFTGPSGTGKTMTAEIMASELKLDLYKTDLSSVVSKYIGETEKNLEKIFNETSSGNAILFFDEADALFGKRSEVKDAHDRYANIETNYLLQKFEEHEGVVILSTNFGKNIDDAFLRRMQFTVEFPFPDKKHRELMWEKIFPEDAPLSTEISYRYLSEKLKISGGNIKNIALASAFLAAEESSHIEMKHILYATRREYQKIGKAFVKSDFVPYLELIDEGSF